MIQPLLWLFLMGNVLIPLPSEIIPLNKLSKVPHWGEREAKLYLGEVKVGAAYLFFGQLRERCDQIVIEAIRKKIEKR